MISVIIPSYNQREYLPEAIETALNQTLKPNEIIVVDDGSTDGSLGIAKKYPVKIISQVNKGLASARNCGIMNSNSDYLFFLDADDIMLPNCLERIQAIIDETQADIIAPSFKEFGIGSAVVSLYPNITLELFKQGNVLPYFCAFKKEKLLEVGGYSPRMTYGYEDMHLHIDLIKRGAKVVTTPEVLIYYRTKQNSMIHEAQAHHGELMAQIYKDHPELK